MISTALTDVTFWMSFAGSLDSVCGLVSKLARDKNMPNVCTISEIRLGMPITVHSLN